MDTNGGDIIARVLNDHGVKTVFTLCGGHISPILVGCKKIGIRLVDVRDEATAVFAADASARLTGIPGVAAVTAGPGVTNTITALKNAQMAQSPLVLFGGAAATVIKGRGSLQDIDQMALVLSLVKSAVTINRNCDIVPVVEHAFHLSRSGTPGPVFVECPIDLLYSEDIVRSWYGSASSQGGKGLKSRLFKMYLDRHVDKMFTCDFDEMESESKPVAVIEFKPAKVKQAMDILKNSKKPVAVIGSQALLDPSEADRLAAAITSMRIPVYLTGMARGLLGRDSAIQMRHQRRDALKTADVILIAGMPCDFRLGYGRAINAQAKLISVNRSRGDLNLNRKPELGVLGDPGRFLITLGAHMNHSPSAWDVWCTQLRKADKDRDEAIEAMAEASTDFINPVRFLKILERMLPENSAIIADGGDFVATAAYILKPRQPLSWLDPGVFGTLGVGAGFALGSGVSRPDRELWLIYGDGAAGYSLQEFDTFVRHGIPLIAVVGNDGSWAQIARDQVQILNDDVGTVLRRTDYHRVAEGYGAKGFLLEDEGEIETVLLEARQAVARGIPVLINVLIGKSDFRRGSISM